MKHALTNAPAVQLAQHAAAFTELKTKALILARMLEALDSASLNLEVIDTLKMMRPVTCSIEKEAAHLVAAILDPMIGLDLAAMPLAIQEAVFDLLRLLVDAGFMWPYEISGGRYGVWGEPWSVSETVGN